MASDNLPGISEAISAAYPKTKIQKCVVHQIRNSMRFVKHDEKREFVKDMKKIYQANNLKAAEIALEKFEET
jgi:transposase-like protein